MNRTELVAAMAEKTQLSKKDADAALKAFKCIQMVSSGFLLWASMGEMIN